MSKAGEREEVSFWERRLFRNTFTYRGEAREVAGWCVKIQWEGRRRTLRLASAGRSEAAREALGIFLQLRRGGWVAVDSVRLRGVGSVYFGGGESRVGVRKYVSDLHPGFERELFAGLTHDGETEHLALGTEDGNAANLRVAEIQSELQAGGWGRVRLMHPREVTVAVFWQANPMTCTYTTLLSMPVSGESGVGMGLTTVRAKGWRVLVVEQDGPVRRAMVHWLTEHPLTAQVAGYGSLAGIPEGVAWDLVLANRSLAPAALRAWTESRSGMLRGRRMLTHGLYADSDAIFASVSGVSRGYFLRRLPPSSLLEPLLGAFPEGPQRAGAEEERLVRRYFQNAFEPEAAVADVQGPAFSGRETQVLELLGRGLSDKEIGSELGISVWTVHSHLKRIFGKYGVRTRTEAVVRHLQK